MSQSGPTSEFLRLLAPLRPLGDAAYRGLPLWMGVLFAGWMLSGVTFVRADEVALVLRFGALVDAGTAQAVRQPGLVIAPPKPLGEVVRVPVRKVFEVEVHDLQGGPAVDEQDGEGGGGLDPRTQGYALSGDRNVVHATLVARYQISDPVAYTFGIEDPERALRTVVVDEMVRASGSRPMDALLTDGRADLVDAVVGATQARLDALGVGVSLVGVELTQLGPPSQVKDAFADVQSAAIAAETRIQEAREYRANVVPSAEAVADALTRDAEAEAVVNLATARGQADAFRSLAAEVRRNPTVARERLYRDGIEGALGRAALVRFVPPPIGGNYNGFRVTVK